MNRPNATVRTAQAFFDSHTDEFLEALVRLCRIPSVSAEGFPPEEVRRSAEATAEVLRENRVENVAVLEVPGVHPYVYGDWLRRPGAPTVLLYGHHDVQPPGRPPKWSSPAFEPIVRKGRLYGRGSADDKGGVMAHVAAVGSYLRSAGELPLNIRFVIEGEEEIGSEHLSAFLAKYHDLMRADFVVLSDTANFDTGVPALTYQLRGICTVDVEVRGLKRPLHSGMWGGPVADPVQILCRLIADIEGPRGEINVPGLYRQVARPNAKQRARLRRLPFDERKYKKDAGLLTGMTLAGEKGSLAKALADTRARLEELRRQQAAARALQNTKPYQGVRGPRESAERRSESECRKAPEVKRLSYAVDQPAAQGQRKR